MNSSKPTNHQVSMDGINAVVNKLRDSGFEPELVRGRRKHIRLQDPATGRPLKVSVKVKRDDWNWQTVLERPDELGDGLPTFWVFVNLMQYTAAPKFWVVTDEWLRKDIEVAHQEYLNRHGGQRARNNDSLHHSIEEERLAGWENRWDVLGVALESY